MRPTPDTLKLPANLANELGIAGLGAAKKGPLRRNGPATRKDKRKAERNEKKVQRAGAPPAKRQKIERSVSAPGGKSFSESSIHAKSARIAKAPVSLPSLAPVSDIPTPKSILKNTVKADPNRPAANGTRSPSPPPKRVSRAVQSKLEEDDAEIAFLEKKLGIKSKKLPQSFSEDGLDDLLSGLEVLDGGADDDADKKLKRESDDWLAAKRRKASKKQIVAEESDDDSAIGSEESIGSVLESSEEDEINYLNGGESLLDEAESSDDEGLEEAKEDDFDGFESEGDGSDLSADETPRVRENPYVAPIVSGGHAPAKYIPPSLRKPAASGSEMLVRLRRQIQGLVNRLTEANLVSILGDIEKIYRENARQHVTSTLVDLLLISICEPTTLPDTLIILPAGFIAAVYKIIGTDFGAQVVQRVVELFAEHYAYATRDGNTGSEAALSAGSKETSNLITLLSELYNFQVVGSNLIFDYIRLFLDTLSELNAELLLKIIRTSGPQLRQDDPSSLKDIVAMLRPAVTKIGEDNISVRTKFMIETINDLKNNKMKTGIAASAVVSEHTIRMKKTLGTLNTRNIKGSEPLRIGLKDIQDSDKKGKWWLVGASWAGNANPNEVDSLGESTGLSSSRKKDPRSTVIDAGATDFQALARAHRMNTDIRRAIFITIMSSSDYSECHLRLLKLNLKKSQEVEIPKVIIYCAGAEGGYNPYYALIAKKLCGDRKLKMAFQFGLWDLFGRMGENDDDNVQDDGDDEGDDRIELRQLVNFAKLFGNLIASNSLSLQVLKKLNLSYLQERTKVFLEVMFISIFLQLGRDEKAIRELVERVRGMDNLVQGLLYFVKKVVRKTEAAGGKKEVEQVKWSCKAASRILEAMSVDGGVIG